MGKGELCIGFWWGNLRERARWGDPGVDGRIMLGWICKKWDVGVVRKISLPPEIDPRTVQPVAGRMMI
jgi:hypothetical protein